MRVVGLSESAYDGGRSVFADDLIASKELLSDMGDELDEAFLELGLPVGRARGREGEVQGHWRRPRHRLRGADPQGIGQACLVRSLTMATDRRCYV
ncbi:unnamed protein product [Leptosia nina]|uniref:Uncharacterized protein n=1 Tax=Leptosia nina TaxID=320188 RepID=A0AAV1J2V3_9NEOP